MGLLQPVSVSAQSTGLYSNRLDTLSFGERFAIKTNAFDWLILTPNIGFEFDLANRNWSKWTIGVYGRYNPSTRHPKVTYNVYDIKELRAELRKYWRTPKYFAYYVGLYGSYDDYQIKFSKNGYKGKGWMGGVSLGFAKRLYAYRNGSNVDFELGLNLGAMYTKEQKFQRADNANRYVYEPEKDWHVIPMVNDLSMSFIYRFGPGIKDRYRKREVVDDAYRRRVNERQLAHERAERERQLRHDSLVVAKQEAKVLKEQQKAEEKAQKEQLKVEKEAMKAQMKAEKQAAKEQRKAEKEAQKAEAKAVKANKDFIQRDEGRESVKLTKEEKKAQKAAEKEAKRAEKEAQKAANASEKDRTKAQLKANKEAAKAAKAAEKEAAKEAKAAAKRNR
ncbi:MAG: DUF3575 domain-containing protein [Bacteroidaceae bacterium]|nr:DUF3575 domain-containing protein [Bacteroidaceae bacterium]